MRRLTMWMLALPLAACGSEAQQAANAPAGARDFAVSGFSSVELAGSDDVQVRIGPGFSVRATGPQPDLDRLDVERNGATLRIARKGNSVRWGKQGHVTIFVTMPAIAAASVSGSGDMRVDRVSGGAFEGAVGGSGDLDIAAIDAPSAAFAVAGSGDLSAKGRVGKLEMTVAGSGEIDAEALSASSASVSITGSGSAQARVAGPASVSIVGSGDVDLGPEARCTTAKTGSGRARCGG